MRHRHVGIDRVRLINSDGHAIGLDIGATSVRAAILSPGTVGGRPSVTAHGLGQVELPPGAVINGVVNNQSAVTQAIKKLWQDNKFECRNVILGIANQQVVVREVNLPNIPAAQRSQALPFQARDIIALPIDQAVLDFIPVGVLDPATDTLPGLLIAVPREPVSAAVRAVERANLKVARVDLSSFAILRSIAGAHLSVEAVVDIGAHLTNIVIHNCGVPKVIRTVARGGQGLTETLSTRMGIDHFEAEEAKRSVGLDGPDHAVANALLEATRPLAAEIRSSMHLYASTHRGSEIERVSLTGGGAEMRGLAAMLSDQLAMPVELIAPMQHVDNRYASKPTQQEHAEHAASAVSVGLAMGAAA